MKDLADDAESTVIHDEGNDLVELGQVSTDTKGSPFGIRADGGGGLTYF